MNDERFLAISDCSSCTWKTNLIGKVVCIHPVFQEKYKDDWKIAKLINFPEIPNYNEIPEFCKLPKKIRERKSPSKIKNNKEQELDALCNLNKHTRDCEQCKNSRYKDYIDKMCVKGQQLLSILKGFSNENQ